MSMRTSSSLVDLVRMAAKVGGLTSIALNAVEWLSRVIWLGAGRRGGMEGEGGDVGRW